MALRCSQTVKGSNYLQNTHKCQLYFSCFISLISVQGKHKNTFEDVLRNSLSILLHFDASQRRLLAKM